MQNKKGLFISFEGGEGAGKSTQISLLRESLQCNGYKVKSLREPGGTSIGEEVRHTLKHSSINSYMFPETELLLMNGSRAQLVREVIRPGLERGDIILCDRFYDSTTAYQGYGRELPLDKVKNIIDLAVGDTIPDITFLINITPKQSVENRFKRNTALPLVRDRFEDDAGSEFFQRVYIGFEEIAKAEPQRIKIIPYSHGNILGMQNEIRRQVYDYIENHKERF